jgi:hypothetical protein
MLLVPNGLAGDAVAALEGGLLANGRGRESRLVLREHVPHLSYLKELTVDIVTALVLLAHPSKNRAGFASLRQSKVLLPEWFETVKPWNLLIAHVCEGAQVLRRPGWAAVFPRWISFDSPIYCFLCFERGRRLWEGIAESVLRVASRSESIDASLSAIRDVYSEAITAIEQDLHEPDGDILNQMYFLDASEHLVSQ